MFAKLRSLFGRTAESNSQSAEEETPAAMTDEAAILSSAVALMAYGSVNGRKAFLVNENLSKAVALGSEKLGISKEDTIKVISKLTKDVVSPLIEDKAKRQEFIRHIENTMPDIDFSQVKDAEVHDFTGGIPKKFDEALDDWKDFSDWGELFQNLSPFDVSTLANEAMNDRGAMAQVHFWNAAIDHMLTAAFLAPELDQEKREATILMASKYQDIVRAMKEDDTEILQMCEKAWEASVIQANSLKESRETLFAIGQINRWGQSI